MKANKIEIQPKSVKRVLTKILDADNNNTYETLEEAAQVRIRYVKPDGKYHRMSIPADIAETGHFTDLNPAQVELVKAACTQAKAIPEDSDIQELHFFCGCHRADVKFNDVTKQPEIVGTVEEAGLSKVGIKYKSHRGTYEINPTDDLTNALPEVKAFADACYAVDGGIYKEVHKLMQLKDEPDVQATETVEVTEEVTEVIGDKAVVKTVTKTKEIPLFDEVPCVDEDGNGICDICNTTHVEFPIVQPKTIEVPRMVQGKKVSDADKARLAELMEKL
jgi:hypothetical protein